MRWAKGYIAVDWGTTNRRGYAIDADGRMSAEMEDDRGILSVAPGEFPAEAETLRARLGDAPLLMAGMVGSNRGWREAPYVPCPAGLDDLAAGLSWVSDDAAIVPGVCYAEGERADVMRGEEVQILGALAAGSIGPDATLCHPGTHNKWVRLAGGRIAAFRTVMTGEMFNLLREHSILADLLGPPAAVGAAFEAGVRRGLDRDDLTAELFAVRARYLLGKAKREDAPSYTSGLLIGADIRVGLGDAGEGEIAVIGRPELTALFAAGLAVAGRSAREIDGEQAFLAGIEQLAERM